ncbi:MAG TPA: hypothetical protein VND70_09060 [Acidimicrobiales bacterium]|nr:hypothetical protein [Acidimicrobiales bacterium]
MGLFGCAPLYRYGDPVNGNSAGGQPFTDLIGLEYLAMQIRSKVLIPATELLKIRQMRDHPRKDASHYPLALGCGGDRARAKHGAP